MNENTSLNPKYVAEELADLEELALKLPIGGVTHFTTVDFPGRLAAVLFMQGCSWKCRYCQNSHLRPYGKILSGTSWKAVRQFLEVRAGILDGVVFSGGEPTAHPALVPAMKAVRKMGFEIGLHTAGIFPERLREAISLCDWVGMDVKAPFDLYEKITGEPGSGEVARESVDVVLESGINYEFRTTVHPILLSEEDILRIGKSLSALGAQRYVLQAFRAQGCLDEELNAQAIPPGLISSRLEKELRGLFISFEIRG